MVRAKIVAVLVATSAGVGWAQPAGFTRTVLQQVEISAPGREAITARAEFATVGASVGRHTHFGEEIGYVDEGAVSVEIDGTTRMVKAGEAFLIPNGKPHNATNAGPGKAVLVITYVVEKGKPLATPVK
jgi:quercetin dioxygenase-like cupin family protein